MRESTIMIWSVSEFANLDFLELWVENRVVSGVISPDSSCFPKHSRWFWWISEFSKLININNNINNTANGRNPAPVDMEKLPLFTGFHTSQVVRMVSPFRKTADSSAGQWNFHVSQQNSIVFTHINISRGKPSSQQSLPTPTSQQSQKSYMGNIMETYHIFTQKSIFAQKIDMFKNAIFVEKLSKNKHAGQDVWLWCQAHCTNGPRVPGRTPPLQMAIPQLVSHPRMTCGFFAYDLWYLVVVLETLPPEKILLRRYLENVCGFFLGKVCEKSESHSNSWKKGTKLLVFGTNQEMSEHHIGIFGNFPLPIWKYWWSPNLGQFDKNHVILLGFFGTQLPSTHFLNHKRAGVTHPWSFGFW